MNRRDYFAAAALPGVLLQGRTAGVVERAFEIADAMCAESDKAFDAYFKASREIDPLAEMAEETLARFHALTPEQKEAELRAQRESWVRGEVAMGSDADEARERERYKVALYRPRTPRVRAMSWTDTPEAHMTIGWMLPKTCQVVQRADRALCVTDGLTTHVINVGDWVVSYPHGEYSILTPQQFEDGFTPD